MHPLRTARACAVAVAALALATGVAACSATGTDDGPADATAQRTGPREIDTPDCVPDDARAVVTGPEDDPVVVVTLGSGDKGIVFAPQRGDTFCEWAPTFAKYAERGYAVASFAWSGSQKASLTGALDVLRGEGVEDYALVGSSIGGTVVAALADDLDPAPAGVLVLSPAASTDAGSARSADSAYTGPLLVIGSATDNAGAARSVARGEDPATYLELPGGTHGLALFVTDQGPLVEQRMAEFLDGALG